MKKINDKTKPTIQQIEKEDKKKSPGISFISGWRRYLL